MTERKIRILACAIACTISVSLLAGCDAKEEASAVSASTPAEVVSASEATSAVVGMPNPVTEVSADQVEIPMAVPEGAADVQYFSIAGGDSPLWEMDFTYEGTAYCYRAQSTSETAAYDISGMFYDHWVTESASVSYCEATVETCSEATVIYWLDVVPGIIYSLSAKQELSAETITEVANLVFTSAQGEAEADSPDAMAEGHYANENGDSVDLVYAGMNNYEVEIGIVGLSTFTGEGRTLDGGVEFTVKDPNEGDLFGIFFPAEDGSFSVTFTQSDWDLLESNTTITGFAAE